MTTNNQVTLKRALGFWQCFGISVGLVVAATTVVSLCNYFGSVGPAFIIPAGVAAFTCILVVMSYAELSSAIPGAGMVVDYTLIAMGRTMSIFSMLAGYIVLISTAGACETFIAGMCAEELFGIHYKVFAGILVALFLIVNLVGVTALGKSQIVLTTAKMATLAALGIGGLLHIFTASDPQPVEFAPYGWEPVLTAMGGGIWLYIGIEYVCPMSEEVIKPEKNIPKAMIAGIITIFVVDMLFGEALVRYVPLDIIATSDVPQLVGAEAMYGFAGFTLLALATICSGASAANSHMAGVPRMLYGLAREGMLPKIFAYIHPRFRTPWAAIFLAVACLSIPFFINVDISSIMTFISMACVAWLCSYIIVQIDVIILRKKMPNMHRPFKTPLYPLPQVIGILICIWAIVTQATSALIGAGVILAVFFLYAVIWVKFVMKKNCFEAVPVEEVEHLRDKIKFDE